MTEFFDLLCKPRRPVARPTAWAAAAALLLLLPGCGGDKSGGTPVECAECAQRAAEPAPNPVGHKAESLTHDDLARVVAQANEALFFDVPPIPASPLLTVETAETNHVDAIRLQMRDNSRELARYIQLRHDFETRLRNEDPEFNAIWKTIQEKQKEYDTLLAAKISNTIVPDRINQHTHRQKALFEQLRKLEEIQ